MTHVSISELKNIKGIGSKTIQRVHDYVNKDKIYEPEIPFPNKKYNIIYADPPWSYDDKAEAGKRGACFKYPVMSIEDIKCLPIQNITANNCVLFLWVTKPKLNEVLDVINCWGFQYKTVAFTWVKLNKKYKSTYEYYKDKLSPVELMEKLSFMGMGRWTRANTEDCIIATKGSIPRINGGIKQTIFSPVEEHSKKPDITRDKIVQLCGDLPRIELFARNKKYGWDCWGNEVKRRCDR